MKSLSWTIAIAFLCFSKFDCLKIYDEDYNLDLNEQKRYERSIMKFQKSNARALCPEAGLISPCVCTIDQMTTERTMNCSIVQNQEELSGVFNQTFSNNDFYELIVDQTGFESNLTSLPSGIFGQARFQIITFTEIPSLVTIAADVCDLMKQDLVSFEVSFCGLTNFSMNFGSYPVLNTIYLSFNHISYFNLVAPTITLLYAGGNELSNDNFHCNTPKVSILALNVNNFNTVPDISPHNELTMVLLKNNSITSLKTSQFCKSSIIDTVSVSANLLTSIEEGSICVVNGSSVYLHTNYLTTLYENVYRPIAEKTVPGGFYMHNNPWICDCGISWVFENNLLDRFSNTTACDDGTLFTDLNPSTLCP